ncbi:MAG: response regulator [Bacteroidota bacterium]
MKHIFLADDDADDKLLFVEAINDIDASINCIMTSNGHEALTLLKAMNPLPDLIFLDVNMPVVNGLDCLKDLRATKRYSGVPIVMLTTSSTEFIRAQAMGANLVLTKPPSFKELKDLLQDVINKGKSLF